MKQDHRIGSEVAGYRIESVIGRGGMGVVYLAHHLRLNRTQRVFRTIQVGHSPTGIAFGEGAVWVAMDAP